KKLPVANAIKLLDYLVELWNSEQNVSSNRNVNVSFYGGEPLLNMEFIKQVVAYLEEANCPSRHFIFSMTTNAILLERYMDYLVEKDFY
ncbi:MAG: 4Fe-4S cluster-binding domain-containing protein, partial [Bacteroidetes bacterium]|nr:4Fe-4S cluster-binding domain-containing protein [Bacteroidota bacterium]